MSARSRARRFGAGEVTEADALMLSVYRTRVIGASDVIVALDKSSVRVV